MIERATFRGCLEMVEQRLSSSPSKKLTAGRGSRGDLTSMDFGAWMIE